MTKYMFVSLTCRTQENLFMSKPVIFKELCLMLIDKMLTNSKDMQIVLVDKYQMVIPCHFCDCNSPNLSRG